MFCKTCGVQPEYNITGHYYQECFDIYYLHTYFCPVCNRSHHSTVSKQAALRNWNRHNKIGDLGDYANMLAKEQCKNRMLLTVIDDIKNIIRKGNVK